MPFAPHSRSFPGHSPFPARSLFLFRSVYLAPFVSFALAQIVPSAFRACERVFIPHPAFGYTIMFVPSIKPSFDSLKASRRSLLSLLRCTAPPLFLLTTRPNRLPFPARCAGHCFPVRFLPGAQDHITRSRVEVLFPSLKTKSKILRSRRRALLEKENFFIVLFPGRSVRP